MSKLRRLIGDINCLDFTKYNNLDGFVMPVCGYSGFASKEFSLEDIRFAKENSSKLIIAKADRIIEEQDLDDFKNVLNELMNINVDYIMFSDMSVLNILKDKNVYQKLIYSNSKLLASYEECKFYEDLGIMVIPSTELTFKELANISTLGNTCLMTFGYLDIFYSKRNLLSLFEEHNRKLFRRDFKNKLLYLEEEKRDSLNPVLENNNGTHIFSDFVHSLYKELPQITPKFYYISSFMLDDKYIDIINLFRNGIDNGINIDDYKKLLETIENISTGFLYKDSNILDEGQ